MARERLSSLQKYILKRIYDKCSITKRGLKSYFNKEYGMSLENRERVTLHRSLANMIKKGLISRGKYKNYVLTEEGLRALIANDSVAVEKNISIKDYEERRVKDEKEYEQYLAALKRFSRPRRIVK